MNWMHEKLATASTADLANPVGKAGVSDTIALGPIVLIVRIFVRVV